MQNNSKVLRNLEQSAKNKKLEKENMLLEIQEQNSKQLKNDLVKLLKSEASSIKKSIQSRSRLLEYKILALIVLLSILTGAGVTHLFYKNEYHLVPKSWTLEYLEDKTPYYIEREEN